MSKIQLSAFTDEASSVFTEQIDAMKANGILYTELRGVDGIGVADLTKEQVKNVKEMLDKEGLKVWSIGSPIGKIDIKDDFEPHLDKFKRVIETAQITGANKIRLFSFYGYDGSDAARDEVLRRMNRFVEVNEGSGVLLCHENEKGIYGDIASRCLDIAKAIPSIKAIFDPANYIQCGQDTLEAWTMLEPYVEYMHIKDADPSGKIVPPGWGIGNIAKIFESYRNFPNPVVSLEPHLMEFYGLAALEKEGEKTETSELVFKTNREAFDFAATELKKLI